MYFILPVSSADAYSDSMGCDFALVDVTRKEFVDMTQMFHSAKKRYAKKGDLEEMAFITSINVLSSAAVANLLEMDPDDVDAITSPTPVTPDDAALVGMTVERIEIERLIVGDGYLRWEFVPKHTDTLLQVHLLRAEDIRSARKK